MPEPACDHARHHDHTSTAADASPPPATDGPTDAEQAEVNLRDALDSGDENPVP